MSILGSVIFTLLKEDESFVTRLGMPNADVVHIQYSSFIFNADYINQLLSSGIKCVATFHDLCLDPKVDWTKLDTAIAHRDDVFKMLPDIKKVIIPSGILTKPVRITSFGLGRNNDVEIKRVCQELGYEFVVSDWKEWVSQEELLELIRSGDGTVLWYPENKGAGSSSCARFVIGARRPLFVNKVEWFKELKDTNGVYTFDDYDSLKSMLYLKYYNQDIEMNNWDEVAKRHIEVYE